MKNYKDFINEVTKTIQLIQVGKVKAKPAGEVKKGDVLLWNYGEETEVLSVSPKGKKSVIITMKTDSDNWVKSFVKTRLIGYK